jgi:hypothetical protein
MESEDCKIEKEVLLKISVYLMGGICTKTCGTNLILVLIASIFSLLDMKLKWSVIFLTKRPILQESGLQYTIWFHIKVKVKLFLCLTKHHDMKTYCGEEVYSLTEALDGGEWSASCPGRFTPRERAPGPIGQDAEWAPEPVWKRCRREKFPASAGNRTPINFILKHFVMSIFYHI